MLTEENKNIHNRRNARESVLKALFAENFSDENPLCSLEKILKTITVDDKNKSFMYDLFNKVIESSEWADKLIKNHLKNWEINRIAQVDRILLKMGICEIYYIDKIPPKVSITEMVEIAKIYSTDESAGFINGVLDSIYTDYTLTETIGKL